jgi:N6-adenosine-specific RNA methylase IME4
MRFKTLLLDPPWPQEMAGKYARRRNQRPTDLPYQTMPLEAIQSLDIAPLTDDEAHCWLWTTNAFLPQSYAILEGWGFKYHNTLTWVKPSGIGNYFIGRTQFLLFGYRGKLNMKEKYHPNVLFASPVKHSQKPEDSYRLIEAVSHEPRVELFARRPRENWRGLGNEIDGEEITVSIKKLSEDTI